MVITRKSGAIYPPRRKPTLCGQQTSRTPVWAVSVLGFAVGSQEWCSRLGCLLFEFCDFLLSRILVSINLQVAEGEKNPTVSQQ